ncbi:probable membrane-associated kinase regulator 1 [Nymphaea colorata]|uniref:Uncharacterized protein n=1 Tax=Nymphaea colorata TaxID=210225 RepID=A0A5K1EWL4_9MAGN|nr:probable membrane-associated kinase regulator 1 [Nymphaea colorata]VVW56733.1 unnamed protein product [Nymphaea colorata]
MEIMRPVDLQLDSACSSPFTTAPSSPTRRTGVGLFYFSAPTSPSRTQSAVVPFVWEESPGKPKGSGSPVVNDFEFEFSARFAEKPAISSADELFYEGKIRPLKLPPRLLTPEGSLPASPKSPKSTLSPKSPKSTLSPKKLLRGAFSRPAMKDFDPFEAALEEARKTASRRERGTRRTRSLSPLRTNFFRRGVAQEETERLKPSSAGSSSSSSAATGSSGKRWRLKDLLFRSASEGREKKLEVKNSSFRSTDSSRSSSNRRVASRSSSQELRYSANRTVSEEFRDGTSVPYRRGFLACLGFGPGSVRGFAGQLGSAMRRSAGDYGGK